MAGSGTRQDLWQLRTPSLRSEYEMYLGSNRPGRSRGGSRARAARVNLHGAGFDIPRTTRQASVP